jgi:hypothetical protein
MTTVTTVTAARKLSRASRAYWRGLACPKCQLGYLSFGRSVDAWDAHVAACDGTPPPPPTPPRGVAGVPTAQRLPFSASIDLAPAPGPRDDSGPGGAS